MMKKPLIITVLLVLIASCRPTDRTGTIKIGLSHGKSHSFSLALERFAHCVEEESRGRYRVRIFHSAQIGSEKEMQEMLTIGSLDICITGILNTYEPLFTLFEMPYLYRDRDHIFKVNNGPVMREVAASLHEKGIILLGFYENGFRHISTTNTPVHVPDDLHGLKIRTPENPAQIQTMKSLGAIPTPLSFSELYTALVQGVVDGQENPLQNIWSGRLYESQQYIAKTGHIYNSAYLAASLRFWNRIPEADREMIRACLLVSSQWQLEYMQRLDQELEDKMQKEGVIFTEPDRKKFQEATHPAYEAIYAALGEEARDIVTRIRETE